jgi:tight adherence protein C
VRALLPPPPRLSDLIARAPVAPQPVDAPHLTAPSRVALRLVPGLVDEHALLRLRQAGLAAGRPLTHVAAEHLAGVVRAALLGGLAAGVAALAVGAAPPVALAVTLLGSLAGGGRQRAQVDRLVEERRRRLRIELYTVNQLLALDVRAGGGVAQALTRLAQRTDGVAADELRDVLAAMRGGVPLDDALEQAARSTPEPAAARTYRLLGKGARYGADLAPGLRALSEDLRRERAEELEREATRRRAAMLVPIIALLAPVMLLFIAAPLPSIVFGAR